MQADGSGHFKDMYGESCRARLDDDMRFCVEAVTARKSVIRVHELQQRMWLPPRFLSSATTYATSCCCVVLSVAYRSVYLYEAGRLLPYAIKLASSLPGSNMVEFDWGTVIFCTL
jgi:hypothetical protein